MIDLHLDRLIDLSLDEDLGAAGDITTLALVPEKKTGKGELWAKEQMVLSGLAAFERVFARVDPRVTVKFSAADGESTQKKQKIAKLEGPLRSLLIGERTALNIVQRMSGIASATSAAVAKINSVKGSRLKLLDTRKTSPGLRALSKQAVRHGGGTNHRFGLFDGVLIKDNHIAAVGGSVREAIRLAKKNCGRLTVIEVEVTSLEQLEEAMNEGVHIVMLDNMSDELVRQAVAIARDRVELEVSGGITSERLVTLAKMGVTYVSMGALTHSARAMDLSLEII
jgi:nicotinate-nucleotide pyrophosphorylase (carboxylating)